MNGNISKYLAFVKTVEYGSFSEAARQLHYSQSGISRMIGDLEEEWGVTLLERSRAGVHLTSEGEALLPRITDLCSDYQNLLSDVDELGSLKSGLIRIGTFASVASHWLPPAIRDFRTDFPDIKFEVRLGTYAQIESWTGAGMVDLGFTGLPTEGNFDVVFSYKDEMVAVLPEDHPLAAKKSVSLQELSREPFMMLEQDNYPDVEMLFRKRSLVPRIQFTSWDDYAIMAMVESGLGVGILPALILRRTPYRLAVRSLSGPEYRRIGPVVKDRRRASRAVKRFLDYLPEQPAG